MRDSKKQWTNHTVLMYAVIQKLTKVPSVRPASFKKCLLKGYAMPLIWDIETDAERTEHLRKGQTEWFIQNAFEVFKTLPPDDTSRNKFKNLPRKKQIKLLRRLIKHLEHSGDARKGRISYIAGQTLQSLRGSAPPEVSSLCDEG